MAPIKISKDIVEEIKQKLDIVDVISESVSLKKTGNNYKGICPFHEEKTPSFVVSPDKQIFYCFGCHTGGDLISFVEKTEKIPFQDVVKKLADKAGIKIEELTYKQKTEIDYRKKLIDINILSRDFFISQISNNRKCLDYINKRNLKNKVLEDFSIGFAPNEWTSLSDFLSNKIENKDASSLGLLKEKEGRFYDIFRNRLMFPICNHRGEVVAFGGRIIEETEQAPKYLNSKESYLYTKGELLYGLNKTGSKIREAGFCIIVEGYMDLIALYQEGIENVAAVLGTSFTEKQADLLKRYTDQIVLFNDSDKAGIKASERSLKMLLSKGFNVRILILEDGIDPDDAIKKYGKEDLSIKIKNSKPLLQKIIIDSIRPDLSMKDLSVAVEEILSLIALIPNDLEKTLWLKEISARTNLNTREIKQLMSKHLVSFSPSKNIEKPREYKVEPIDKKLIQVLFLNPNFINKIYDEEWDRYVPNYLTSYLFDLKNSIKEMDKHEFFITEARKHNLLWVENLISKIILEKDAKDMNLEEELKGCVFRYKIKILKTQLLKNRDKEKTEKTLRERQAIVKEIKVIEEELKTFTNI